MLLGFVRLLHASVIQQAGLVYMVQIHAEPTVRWASAPIKASFPLCGCGLKPALPTHSVEARLVEGQLAGAPFMLTRASTPA